LSILQAYHTILLRDRAGIVSRKNKKTKKRPTEKKDQKRKNEQRKKKQSKKRKKIEDRNDIRYGYEYSCF